MGGCQLTLCHALEVDNRGAGQVSIAPALPVRLAVGPALDLDDEEDFPGRWIKQRKVQTRAAACWVKAPDLVFRTHNEPIAKFSRD